MVPHKGVRVGQSDMHEEIMRAEGYLLQGEAGAARALLARLAEDVEEYVDRNCPTTDEVQWFSFPTIFDRLAYRRVEDDPRELRDVGEPISRLYGDLALACTHEGDYDTAIEALKQAIRWNPMACEHRLNLAELYRRAGDMQEYLALTFTVFERASRPEHLVRAFLTFAEYFTACKKPKVAASALRMARRLDAEDFRLGAALDQAAGTDHDPDLVSDEEARGLLGAEGLPDGANAEIAICLLMCATDAAQAGDRNLATTLTMRARDLVGEEAALALMQLIRSEDEDMEGDPDGAAG